MDVVEAKGEAAVESEATTRGVTLEDEAAMEEPVEHGAAGKRPVELEAPAEGLVEHESTAEASFEREALAEGAVEDAVGSRSKALRVFFTGLSRDVQRQSGQNLIASAES